MNLQEFKAWFEGFTEDMDGPPTAEQFAKIKKKVAKIDGIATSYPIYIDRYVQPWRPYWDRYWSTWGGGIAYGDNNPISYSTGNVGSVAVGSISYSPDYKSEPPAFDSLQAMRELGKMEFSTNASE